MIFWIFQTGEPLPSDKIKPRKMRAYNLADTLIKKGTKLLYGVVHLIIKIKYNAVKRLRKLLLTKT